MYSLVCSLEWYDPYQGTTQNGYLALKLETATLADSHGLGYLGGMIQSWNKFCFTGEYNTVLLRPSTS
jgi:beta-glucanase (GH16 family)